MNEDQWLIDQRRLVEDYLSDQGILFPAIDEVPAFQVYPYLALWAVESKKAPGSIGWWAISGDLPTDYLSRGDGREPREALMAFARNWAELAECMMRGEAHPECRIGMPEDWPKLGNLLMRRAEMIRDISEDDAIWTQGEV